MASIGKIIADFLGNGAKIPTAEVVPKAAALAHNGKNVTDDVIKRVSDAQSALFKGAQAFQKEAAEIGEAFVTHVKDGMPLTSDISQISAHHYVNSNNCDIRWALKHVQNGLKGLDDMELEQISLIMKIMNKYDGEFSKLPPLEDKCVFYRGRAAALMPRFNEDFDIIANAKVGDIIVPDRGYSYATFDKTLAQGWTSSSGESILYEIHVPKGAKLSCNMEHGGEALFPRGAEYRLISKEKVDNTTTVKMEYILPGN